jgi:hypothetical protein
MESKRLALKEYFDFLITTVQEQILCLSINYK